MTQPWHHQADDGAGHLRASAADRDRALEMLKTGFAEGRLSKDELEERAGQLHEPRTYADLAALTADLPAAVAAVPAVPEWASPAKAPQHQVNPLALAAVICALIPGVPAAASIVMGLAARRQIRETGERGAGVAAAAIAIGSFSLSAFLLFLVMAAIFS